LNAEQIFEEYAKATIPAIYKKYEVKRMFGTNRHSACWFGRQVPALVVKQAADSVGDTYPHRESGNLRPLPILAEDLLLPDFCSGPAALSGRSMRDYLSGALRKNVAEINPVLHRLF